jgi:hypothetical protein
MSSIGASGGGVIGDPPGMTPGWTPNIPLWPPGQAYPVIPAPRTMPVNVPFSDFGETIVRMDRYGNITIKVEQNE